MSALEVVVAGAGPAGAVAAAMLAREGREVGLIDPGVDQSYKIGETLPQVGAQLLQRLGLPAPRDDGPHRAITGVRSIWGEHDLLQDALNLPGGGGWRLDRRRFDRQLRDAARDAGALTISDFVRDIECTENGFVIETAALRQLSASIVIDCTGRRARLARQLGATQSGDEPVIAVWSVGQVPEQEALACSQTLIESGEHGWWYGAVLPDGAPLAIFHTTPAVAGRLARNPDAWCGRLAATRVIGAELPVRHFRHGALRRCDARGLSLDLACGDNWFACGDAALSFNPLASQGLYNAIATAATAAKLIGVNQPCHAKTVYQSQIDSIRSGYLTHLRQFQRGSQLQTVAVRNV